MDTVHVWLSCSAVHLKLPQHCQLAMKVKVTSLSRVRLFATPWTAAYHAPPPMGFSRQEYWHGVPLPSRIEYSLN